MDKKTKLIIIVNSIFAICSIICIIFALILVNHLTSQKMSERWKGESEMDFSQISVFVPVSKELSIDNINSFRTQINDKIKEQLNDSYVPFVDAYSCFGNLKVSSDRSNADVETIAIGGSFFDFHPLKLLSGNYITDSDNDLNRVVIDEELAWLLFGSTNVAGMELSINGLQFYVAGVVDREDDYTTSKTYTSDMYLFINYRTYAYMATGKITSDNPAYANMNYSDNNPGLTCYEIVLANPVKNFAINLVTEKFPVKGCDIVENTGRFSISNLFSIMKDYAARVIASNGVAYPYWENSARYTENKAAMLVETAILLIVLPFAAFAFYSTKNIRWTHNRLHNNTIPVVKEKLQESIRVRQRKRWEKKNPDKV